MAGILTVLMAVSLLTGCAQEASQKNDSGHTIQEQTGKEFLWQEQKLADVKEITEGSPLYIADYQDNLVQRQDFTSEYTTHEYLGVYNDRLYIFSYYRITEKGEFRYFLNTYDLHSKGSQCTEFVFDIPEIPNFHPACVWMAGEDKIVCFCPKYNEDGSAVTNYYAVYLNMQSEVLEVKDIYPAMKEFGIVLKPGMALGGMACDGRGYLYICDEKLPRVGVIDNMGALTDIMEIAGEYDGGALCTCSMISPEGIPIFEVSSVEEKKNTLFWYDSEKKSMRIMAETNCEGLSQRCINPYGEIYYCQNSSIVRWNGATGERERVFDCKSNGISMNSYLLTLVTDSEGKLFMVDFSEDFGCIYEFSDKKVEKSSNIRIANINWALENDNIEACAATFTRKNPSCSIELEDGGANSDITELQAYHDRIMAEIVAGEGPELLIVNREDLRTLYEKGVLADLSDVLPQDVEEQIFSGVLQAGTFDGKLVGLADGVETKTMFVPKDIWAKDIWTVEEFVNLVEEKEGELEVIFADEAAFHWNAWYVFYYMAMNDLENSPFIDWEKGECNFDCELFRKVLELSKRYEHKDDIEEYMKEMPEMRKKNQVELVNNGQALAFVDSAIGSLTTFSQDMAILGENYNCVGFPTGGGCGSYISCDNFLVVNKAAKDLETIYKYIQYLYEIENQRKGGYRSVRKDVVSSFVVYADYWPDGTKKAQYSLGDGVFVLLESKPDGTSYLEEYLEYVDNCVPEPAGTEAVWRIISEEADLYFEGGKDIDWTVDAIQKRVQLYLDEQ